MEADICIPNCYIEKLPNAASDIESEMEKGSEFSLEEWNSRSDHLKFVPPSVAGKIDLAAEMSEDEVETEDDENNGERQCEDRDSQIF